VTASFRGCSAERTCSSSAKSKPLFFSIAGLTLDEVVQMVPGVTHIEIDAESNLELVRELDIRRTPTVLVLDKRGAIRKRASGAPRKVDVIAAIGEISR
jgi:hypothetical protein